MLKDKSLRTRRFIAKYITYLEVFGYLFVLTLAAGIFAAWFYQVDDGVKHAEHPEIQPKETVVTNEADAYVTRLLVAEKFQRVRKGDPIVEIVDDPAWVDRYRAVLHLQAALQEWTALEEKLAKDVEGRREAGGEGASEGGNAPSAKPILQAALHTVSAPSPSHPLTLSLPHPLSPSSSLPLPSAAQSPLPPEDTSLWLEVERALATWHETAGARAPRKILRAEHDGVVVFDETTAGQIIGKKKEIAKVADFGELQIKLKLLGENQPDVRVGQPAKIEVRADQPPMRLLRGDREGFLWRAERVLFNDLMDEEIKNWLRDELKKTGAISRDDGEDLAFEVTDVDTVRVDAKLRTRPVMDGELAAARGDRLQPYRLPELKLRGHVAEVKHTAKFSLAELPPLIQAGLRQKLLAKVQGKVVETDEPFRIDGFRSMAVTATVKGEAKELPRDEEERERQVRKALLGAKSERVVEATIVLDRPPPEVTDAVRALYQQDKPAGPRVDVEVVTDRRRFAMLLFRQ